MELRRRALDRLHRPTVYAVPGNVAANIFAYGNMGRNTLRGPHLFNWEMSLHKSFRIYERLRFTFRAEAYNVWNNPEFANPAANIQAATFGNITATSTGSRCPHSTRRENVSVLGRTSTSVTKSPCTIARCMAISYDSLS